MCTRLRARSSGAPCWKRPTPSESGDWDQDWGGVVGGDGMGWGRQNRHGDLLVRSGVQSTLVALLSPDQQGVVFVTATNQDEDQQLPLFVYSCSDTFFICLYCRERQ